VVVGGWLVQAQGTPQISINTFSYYTIIRVLRINSVLYRMERLRSPFDPSLIIIVILFHVTRYARMAVTRHGHYCTEGV